MSEPRGGAGGAGTGAECISISLRSERSSIRASDGRDIPFGRAVLVIGNGCSAGAMELVPHASLGQEGGTVQDVSHALTGVPGLLPAGGTVEWDVFDRLLSAHAGTASRVHMFGYRAVLNWVFELSVWVAFPGGGAPERAQTPVKRWSLQWSAPDAATGAVVLAVDAVNP